MSAELSKARQLLAQVRVNVKQEKFVPAAQALQFSLGAVLKNPLIKSEREEFEKLLAEAMDYFVNADTIMKVYPLKLTYAPGSERALYDTMRDVITELSRTVLEDAQAQVQAREQKKKNWLARGLEELQNLPSKGQASLAALIREYPDDAELRGAVGEALLKVGLYEQAVIYLTEALDLKPDMLPCYNTIGMALRKLSRFDVAESYYLRASQYLRHDPNLYFNIGRLYVDWKKWDKAKQAAMAAMKLNPDFVEAQKLFSYAEHQAQLEEKRRS